MSLTTIMYHFVFREPCQILGGIPHTSWDIFEEHLRFIAKTGRFLSKNERVSDFIENDRDHRYLLSFDDSLKCHSTDVLPVLEERDIQAAFSIYTDSVMNGHVSLLERQRFLQYSLWDYDEFLDNFLSCAREFITDAERRHKLVVSPANIQGASSYLAEEHYYSDEERFYRYCRDVVLNEDEFTLIIDRLFKRFCDERTIADELYLSPASVRALSDAGHTVLAHSVTHPIRMDKLPRDQMEWEMVTSLNVIEHWTGRRPTGFAYPCGRVNQLLLEVVREAGIEYAFVGGDSSNFNVPGPPELKLYRIDAAEFTRKVVGC